MNALRAVGKAVDASPEMRCLRSALEAAKPRRRDVKLLALDPTLTNLGLAKLLVNPDTLEVEVEDIDLVETENAKAKTVRQSSDDMRRAGEVFARAYEWLQWSDMVCAEIPSGGQSARAAFSFGAATMLCAVMAHFRPPIQVSPGEVKKVVTGRKTASKDEIIQWAHARWPDAPWKRHKYKGEMVLTDKNEHMADACAIGMAAIRTPEFRSAIAMLGALRAESDTTSGSAR